MEKQNKDLKFVELKTAHRTKTKANTATEKSKSNNMKVKQQANSLKVQVITAAKTVCWDNVALRQQMAYNDVQHILQEVKARQHPKGKDTAHCSPICKSYWTQ